MRTIIVFVALGALATGTHRLIAAEQSANGKCSELTGLRLPDLKITEAAAVPAASSGPIRAAHCRVTGVIGTEIRFQLLLPDNWNQKFFMGGGGGFVGSIQNSAQSTVNLGFATAGTDTGHQGAGTDASWAHNNIERQVNFGYLGVHRTAETSKAIIASYYGKPAARNYFQGCSRGGGQALMEAQRFPADFDGIISGAPAYDWTGIAATMIRNMQALFPNPNKIDALMFTPDLLKTVETRILESCDKQDGIGDGVIDDPRRCKVDVNALPLTAAQKNALKVIYSPTAGRRGRADGRLADLDHRRQAAGGRPGAEPALRIRHRHRQVPGVQRSRLGLQQVQLLDLEEGLGARGQLPQRDQPGPRRVQLARRQADPVARVGGPGADAAGEHPLSRAGPRARPERRQLLPDVPDAGRAALRRRCRSRHRGLDRGDRPVGRERQGAGSGGCDEDAGWPGDAQPPAVSVSAEGRVQRIRQHRR
jgi:hypothetical protein